MTGCNSVEKTFKHDGFDVLHVSIENPVTEDDIYHKRTKKFYKNLPGYLQNEAQKTLLPAAISDFKRKTAEGKRFESHKLIQLVESIEESENENVTVIREIRITAGERETRKKITDNWDKHGFSHKKAMQSL